MFTNIYLRLLIAAAFSHRRVAIPVALFGHSCDQALQTNRF